MRRDEFLEKYWKPYPAVSGEVFDCSQLAGKSHLRVGGRLIVEGSTLILNSGGARVEIHFGNQSQWSDFSVQQQTPFSGDLLRTGDVLLIEGKLNKDAKRIESEKVALLVPTQDSDFKNEFSVPQAQKWSDFLKLTRQYFYEQGFNEARTPTLVPSPGTEPFLDAFSTETTFENTSKKMFLPTSPEFHLKKLLVAGHTRIFELKECFRNNERGEHHQPEFLMLEWYRAYSDLSQIEEDCRRLFAKLSSGFGIAFSGMKKKSIRQFFIDVLGCHLKPTTSKQELITLARENNVAVGADDSWDDIYFRIFLEKIEPHLNQDEPILIHDYPPSQAALARINQHGWADRFEIYWRGYEIANAFHELNDPQANIKRFEKDAIDARQLGKVPVPHDVELVEALKKGMPPSGGIALGMDRLFMALTGARTIGETRAFPFRTV